MHTKIQTVKTMHPYVFIAERNANATATNSNIVVFQRLAKAKT